MQLQSQPLIKSQMIYQLRQVSMSVRELAPQLSTQYLCVCPCCTITGPPNQPLDVKDSKQSYSHHSEKLKKRRLTLALSRLVGMKSIRGYQYVLHVTEYFVIHAD